MHPRVLSNEETFKRQVLAHFSDVLQQSLAHTSGTQVKVRDTSGVRAVSQVLSEMPGDFVFSEIEFVEHVLRHAGRFGRERKEEAQFALYRAATLGMRSGTRGKPFPQDIAMKQSAEGALARIRPGSPARKLFTWIRDHAHEQIQRAHIDAELLEDDE